MVIKPAKALIDFEYMRSATFRSDLILLWNTFTSCLGCSTKEGAGGLGELMTLVPDQAWQEWIASLPRRCGS
jgi:hypothetical protein